MKVTDAALPFLILAAALGTQARVIHDTETRELMMEMHKMTRPMIRGFHRPADCCLSYTSRSIRCVFMRDYFVTSSSCSQPGVIFYTKKGQRVCANPRDSQVQDCMTNLKLKSDIRGPRIRTLAHRMEHQLPDNPPPAVLPQLPYEHPLA
ncbi:C-C motif chemokine 15-like [Microcebus murinus]|uniref:C-C motif chemokine 15-like n=1 Tax=Microcebus murinus TaxID=30608 RepID=UPI003F6BB823